MLILFLVCVAAAVAVAVFYHFQRRALALTAGEIGVAMDESDAAQAASALRDEQSYGVLATGSLVPASGRPRGPAVAALACATFGTNLRARALAYAATRRPMAARSCFG